MNRDAVIRRNNVQVLGNLDGPALVLVQGFGCDQVIWDRMLPKFTGSYKVVLLDHVGTGGADPDAYDPVKYAGLDGYVRDMREVMAALDLQDATVVGHSIAGAMSLAAAVDNPQIGRLVLLCTSACYLNDGSYIGGFAEQDIEKVLAAVELNYPLWAAAAASAVTAAPDGSALSSELAGRLCRLQPEFVRDFLRMSFAMDIRPLLRGSSTPALILQTLGDPLTPTTASDYLRSQLSSGTFRMLDTYGSMPHITAADATAEAIVQFLKVSHG